MAPRAAPTTGDSPRTIRVAMCGTFDVRNYGDLLFPLVLQHELGKRIPAIEVECFSYHARVPPEWPYVVSPISRLPDAVAGFDGVVIGGGHLIRFDKDIAAGYAPPAPEMHHPTSYWLFPALLALEANIPLIWSAVGVSAELPSWGCELLKEVLRVSTYVSVRDDASQRVLQPLADKRDVFLVPDTVFGIQDLHLEGANGGAQRANAPYVVIQASPHLAPYAEPIRRLLQWLKGQQFKIVVLPISPALGDDPEVLKEIVGNEAFTGQWVNPGEVAATIANAAAVVGVSLHLSVTALAYGVPVLRPFQNTLSKYQSIHDLPRVFSLESYHDTPQRIHHEILHGSGRSKEIDVFCASLAKHWDRVAAILTAPPCGSSSRLASLFQRLPFLLESASGFAQDGVPERNSFFRRRR